MVVKIPIKRGKRTSEQAVLESPGTKTTMVTNEKDAPCKLRAVAAKKKRRKTNSNEGDVGDNSSISSRSSMNSDRDVRDRVEGGKSTTYGSSANAATAATSSRALPSEDYTLTICSPSDQSREQIDHTYSSPDTLLIGVSVVCWKIFSSNYYQFVLTHVFLFLHSMIGATTAPKPTHIKISQFYTTSKGLFPYPFNH